MTSSTVAAGRKRATLKDIEALPDGARGEIINGELILQPKARIEHQAVIGDVHSDLDGPFQKGRGGPGGWWIVVEPGFSVEGGTELCPDLAGWRKARMKARPFGRIKLRPDWVCEVLSPSNRRYDLVTKKAIYAKLGVPYLWIVDIEARCLFVSKLEDGRWVEVGNYGGNRKVKPAPFGEVTLHIGAWWEGLPAVEDE